MKKDNTMTWLIGGGVAVWLFWPINKAGQYESGQAIPKTNNFTLLLDKVGFGKNTGVQPVTSSIQVAPTPLLSAAPLPPAQQTTVIDPQYYDYSNDLVLPEILSGVGGYKEEM